MSLTARVTSILRGGNLPSVSSGVLKQPVADFLLDDVDGLLELLGYGLTLQGLDSV